MKDLPDRRFFCGCMIGGIICSQQVEQDARSNLDELVFIRNCHPAESFRVSDGNQATRCGS